MAATVKTKGIVVRETGTGESDRILTLLSEDLGRIQVAVRGARRSGSRLAGASQPLVYGEYVLYPGRSMYSMNDGTVLASFYNLTQDLDRLTEAGQCMRMAADAAYDPKDAPHVVRLLLFALRALEQASGPLGLVLAAFTFKLMQICGQPPHVRGCLGCGTTAIDTIRFSIAREGFLCETCTPTLDAAAWVIAPGVARAILHVLVADIPQVFRFSLPEDCTGQLAALADHYRAQHWETREGSYP